DLFSSASNETHRPISGCVVDKQNREDRARMESSTRPRRIPHHRRMMSPSEHLRGVAARIVKEVQARVPLRGALLTGSAGRGEADYYSDIDLLCYVDQIPSEHVGAAVREAIGGTKGLQRAATEDVAQEGFEVNGMR